MRRRLGRAGAGGAATLVLAALLGAAPADPNPAASADPFVRAVARTRSSVAAVGSYEAKDTPSVRYFGSGFVVHDGHLIATNRHVVEGVRQADRLDRLRVFFPDDTAVSGRPARVLAEDALHDVALVHFEGPPLPALKLSDAEPAQGQAVGVVGYPIGLALGLVPAAHKGVVAAVVPSVLPLPKGARMTPELAEAIRRPYMLYQLDLVVFPGNSGSPLLDATDGRVLGIINKVLATATREHLLSQPSGISYAVPVRWVEELVARNTAASQPAP